MGLKGLKIDQVFHPFSRQVCLKIKQQGSTKNITFFPFLSTCLRYVINTFVFREALIILI